MTIIELFDKDAIENVCSGLILTPERVILVGFDAKLMKTHAARYEEVLKDRGVRVSFEVCPVNSRDVGDLVEALAAFVEKYDDCLFDVTGGDDLFLTAAGIICERFRSRGVQMHRINLRNNTVTDVDQDGKVIRVGDGAELSVEEVIRFYGGKIVYPRDRAGKDTTLDWDLTSGFLQDVDAMWKICRSEVVQWNTQITVIGAADRIKSDLDPLTISSVPVPELKKRLEREGTVYKIYPPIIRALYEKGLILYYHYDDETFSLRFKDEQVRRCLTVAGQILELKIYLAALAVKEDKKAFYGDVMTGVNVDWDGEVHTEGETVDTENEIDVIMTCGMVPVFVSCKNGAFGAAELYKLNTVATRFGGKYAKKILVSTALRGDKKNAPILRQRARDMGIRIVEYYPPTGANSKHLTEMDEGELIRLVKSFYLN